MKNTTNISLVHVRNSDNEPSTKNRIRSFYRRAWFSGLLALALFAAGCYGFYLGWAQIKRPILLVLAFNNVTDSPKIPQDISSDSLNSIIKRLRTHDYQAIDPEVLKYTINKGFSGRNFIIAFKGGYASSAATISKLHTDHAIKSVFFIDPEVIGQSDKVTKEQLLQLQKQNSCKFGLTTKTAQADPNNMRHQLAELLQSSVDFYTYSDRTGEINQPIASAGFELVFMVNGHEIPAHHDNQNLPMVEYVKGAEEAGEPSAADWLPPKSARYGALSITLAILVQFIALSWCFKAFAYLKAARILRASLEAAKTP